MTSIRAATVAFRESFLHPDGVDATGVVADARGAGQWARYESRRLRYAILWACYSNDQYRDGLHNWAKKYRADYGLYRNTRSLYGPFYRLAEMQVAHIQGGPLDPAAGDGKAVPSGIPIAIPAGSGDEDLRAAIARLWRDSRWQSRKDVWVRWGAVLGDVALAVRDDPGRGYVALEPVHPRSIVEAEVDRRGAVRGYCREEYRPDPTGGVDAAGNPRLVRYGERCWRGEGDAVHYETTLDGKPYAWNGVASAWEMPYGFVPMVLTQHVDVGLDWGLSEAAAAIPLSREADDVGSKLNDQIRKLVEAPWLVSGVKASDVGAAQQAARKALEDASPQAREADRENALMIFVASEHARAQALVADVKVEHVSAHIDSMLEKLDRDYPELRFDRIRASGAASGNAIREARKPAETKLRARRAAYDEAIVRAHQMAIAIGGMHGYEGYQGFGLGSYADGRLDHRVADRPVFEGDPMEDLQEETLFWQTAAAAASAGVPIALWLERHGWSPEDIARIPAATATPTQVN